MGPKNEEFSFSKNEAKHWVKLKELNILVLCFDKHEKLVREKMEILPSIMLLRRFLKTSQICGKKYLFEKKILVTFAFGRLMTLERECYLVHGAEKMLMDQI